MLPLNIDPVLGPSKPSEKVRSTATTVTKIKEISPYDFLRKHVTFSQLPDSALIQLAECCRVATINAGQYISTEGEEGSLYGFIVVSGRLAMTKTSLNGKELVVELLPPGDIFGLLLGLASGRHRSELSARAQAKSKVLWIPIQNLARLLDSHPTLYKEFSAHLLECLQSSYRISRGLAHDRVEVRIAAILTTLALKFSRPLNINLQQANTIDITRQQLADLTGTTPETAIRVTRSMQRGGLIDIKRPGIIQVLDTRALQELAEA